MSKVDQDIIRKYNLKRIPGAIGNSFVNDVYIYLIPNFIIGYKCFLYECDYLGNPLPDGVFMIIVQNRPKLTDIKYTYYALITEFSIKNIEVHDLLDNYLLPVEKLPKL